MHWAENQRLGRCTERRTPEISRGSLLNILPSTDQGTEVKKADKDIGKNNLKELETAVPSTQMVLKIVPVSTSQIGSHQDS